MVLGSPKGAPGIHQDYRGILEDPYQAGILKDCFEKPPCKRASLATQIRRTVPLAFRHPFHSTHQAYSGPEMLARASVQRPSFTPDEPVEAADLSCSGISITSSPDCVSGLGCLFPVNCDNTQPDFENNEAVVAYLTSSLGFIQLPTRSGPPRSTLPHSNRYKIR